MSRNSMRPSARQTGFWASVSPPLLVAAISAFLLLPTSLSRAEQSVMVLIGAPGNDEFKQQFSEWAEKWKAAATDSGATFTLIGGAGDTETNDRQKLIEFLKEERSDSPEPLWIVLIGHGTFDGRIAKFNLRGPDISARELADQLRSFRRPLAVVNCASASAPFINELSGADRVIVTATKSGYQYNFARFGRYLAESISDPRADLDKDEQTSLLEAFLFAAARVSEFYTDEGRLATEDAILDDNGDQLGTMATWFRGVRTVRTPAKGAAADGLRANQFLLLRSESEQRLTIEQRRRRDELEAQIETLRGEKKKLAKEDYYDRLQVILEELAGIYEQQP